METLEAITIADRANPKAAIIDLTFNMSHSDDLVTSPPY